MRKKHLVLVALFLVFVLVAAACSGDKTTVEDHLKAALDAMKADKIDDAKASVKKAADKAQGDKKAEIEEVAGALEAGDNHKAKHGLEHLLGIVSHADRVFQNAVWEAVKAIKAEDLAEAKKILEEKAYPLVSQPDVVEKFGSDVKTKLEEAFKAVENAADHAAAHEARHELEHAAGINGHAVSAMKAAGWEGIKLLTDGKFDEARAKFESDVYPLMSQPPVVEEFGADLKQTVEEQVEAYIAADHSDQHNIRHEIEHSLAIDGHADSKVRNAGWEALKAIKAGNLEEGKKILEEQVYPLLSEPVVVEKLGSDVKAKIEEALVLIGEAQTDEDKHKARHELEKATGVDGHADGKFQVAVEEAIAAIDANDLATAAAKVAEAVELAAQPVVTEKFGADAAGNARDARSALENNDPGAARTALQAAIAGGQ